MLKISISYFDWQTIALTFLEKKKPCLANSNLTAGIFMLFSGFVFMFKQFEIIIEVFIRFFAWATFH